MIGKRIEKLNNQNSDSHNKYLEENRNLITVYKDKKDEYDNKISIINSEKVAMREEIRRLYDFLSQIGKSLDKRVTIFDFKEETFAPNLNEDVVPAVNEKDGVSLGLDYYPIEAMINKKIGSDYEKEIYWKSIEYIDNLKKKKQLISRMDDCIAISQIYLEAIVIVKDAIRNKIIPELEFIKAFLYADYIREKYVAGKKIDNIEMFPIKEYERTKYNNQFQFVKNSFDFYDLTTAFFSKQVLTDLLKKDELTEEVKEEFNQSIYSIQDKLVLLEDNMEVR